MAARLDISLFVVSCMGCMAYVGSILVDWNRDSNGSLHVPEIASNAQEISNPFAFDPSLLIGASPFGASPSSTAFSPVQPSPTTQIKLLGVLASTVPRNSWAVLSVNGANPAIFRLGDSVADGIRLDHVLSTHVIVQYPDRVEEVYLASDEQTSGVQVTRQAAPASSAPVNTNDGLEALSRLAPVNPSYGQPVEEVDNSVDGIIARYREALRVNPDSVRMRLGIERTDKGYVVKGVTAPVMLTAGFKPGDIITSINGKPTSSVDSEVELFDRVISSSTAQVELIRNGETIVKSFPIP